MMHPQVFILGLILLLPGAVGSHMVVNGLVGDPVTLPCTYSADLGITTTCWGLGECQSFYCARTLIWTNGYQVTYKRSSRYQLKGHISKGNVSLTIENAVQSDSGSYCCTVEIPGSSSYVTFSLEVQPQIPTRPPTRPITTRTPTTTRSTTTGKPTTMSTRSTHVPTSPTVSTSPTTPTYAETHTPEPTTFSPDQTTAEVTETPSHTLAGWNYTMTSSVNSSHNYIEDTTSWKPQNSTKDFHIDDISISPLWLLPVLLLPVCTVTITRHMRMKRKSWSLSLVSLHVSKNGPFQDTVVVQHEMKTKSTRLKTVLTLQNKSQWPSEGLSAQDWKDSNRM